MSPVQQGMYFHHLHKKNRVYVEQWLCDVIGPVEVAHFELCLNKLVEAHECLRTIFVNEGRRGPRQVVLPYRPRRLRYRDLSTRPDPDAAFAADVERDIARNFDLAVEASRCELVKLGPDRHTFLWTYSHLITDTWAVRVMEEQFCALYRSAHERAPVPELPRFPYRLYVEWIERQDEHKARAYWTQYLEGHGCHAGAALPASDVDEQQVTARVECGARGRELVGAIARHHNATINHILLAAWGTYVLAHYQRAEAIFGCVVSGRMIRLPDVDQISGLFVNTIPIRIRQTDTVARAIAQIRQHAVRSAEHSYLSLSVIMAYGNTTPSSLLTGMNFQFDRLDLAQARSLPFAVRNIRHNEQGHNDAYVNVYLPEGELTLVVHYDPRAHRFDAATVQHALGQILEQFHAHPESALSDALLTVMGTMIGHELPALGTLDFGASANPATPPRSAR
jgi:hypothetical protein